MITKYNKKIIIGLVSFVLLVGLVYGSMNFKAYAFSFNDCQCVLDSVTIGNSNGDYTTGDTSYYIDNNVTEFAIEYMNCTVLSAGAISGGAVEPDYHYFNDDSNDIRPKVHPIRVYYSFDDSTYTSLFSYDKSDTWTDRSIQIGDEDDLYFKFVLMNKEADVYAKKIHIERTSAPSITSIIAEPSELPSKGGSVNIKVAGDNLPANLEVRAYGSNNEDTGIVSTSSSSGSKNIMAVTSTGGSFTLNFPANDTDTNKTYIVRAVQNGDPFIASAKVTVLAEADLDNTDNDSGNNINNNSKDKVKPAGSNTADENDFLTIMIVGLTAMLVFFITLLVFELRKIRFIKD